jgi:hypothetical protein
LSGGAANHRTSFVSGSRSKCLAGGPEMSSLLKTKKRKCGTYPSPQTASPYLRSSPTRQHLQLPLQRTCLPSSAVHRPAAGCRQPAVAWLPTHLQVRRRHTILCSDLKYLSERRASSYASVRFRLLQSAHPQPDQCSRRYPLARVHVCPSGMDCQSDAGRPFARTGRLA